MWVAGARAAHARIRIHSMNSECQEIECQEFQIVRCECQEILLRKALKWHPLYASVEPWDEVHRAPPPMGRAAIEPFSPNAAIGVKLQCQEIAVCKEFRILNSLPRRINLPLDAPVFASIG